MPTPFGALGRVVCSNAPAVQDPDAVRHDHMFYVRKILSTLVLPPVGPVLLALFGIWLARSRPRLGAGVAAFALLGLVALSLPPVAEALVHSLETQPVI